jgi:hypothetical protein
MFFFCLVVNVKFNYVIEAYICTILPERFSFRCIVDVQLFFGEYRGA